jgi:hypothetical protein
VARPTRRRSMICSSASWRSERRAQLLRDDCRAIAAPQCPAGAVAIARARHAGCCRLVRVATDACESRSPIRPTAHRVCGGTRSCDRICKNFFRRVRARENRPTTLSRHACEHFMRARMVRRGSTMMLRNPCATRLSCTRCKATRSLDCGRDGCSTSRAGHRMRRQRLSATPRDCPPFVKWSRCFLRCAVVIGVQCSSIRECTVP